MSISRRKFTQYSSLGLGGLLLSPSIKANGMIHSLSAKSGAFKLLRKNVGYFTGRGGTIGWLVNDEAIVAVDSQFPASAKDLIAEIKKNTDRKFDYLVNTHHHGDHTAGNVAFKDLVTNIVAHENSKANQKRVAVERGKESEQLYPGMTFSTKWSVEVGDEILTCTYHGRGHTDGDILTHFENANIVHTGDLLFNRRFPYIDKSAGAHIGNWINILDGINSKFDSDTLFIFGHSGEGYEITGGHEDVKAFKNYLEKMLEFAEKSFKSGKSLDELKASVTDIPGAPEWKGKGIARSLDAAYAELEEEK